MSKDEKGSSTFGSIKNLAKSAVAGVQTEVQNIDMTAIKDKAVRATGIISGKAVEIKDAAIATKDELTEKLTELDRMLESSITEYNDAYTLMNDKGVKLYVERRRATDAIDYVEKIVNSIANHPKEFDSDFSEIETNRKSFVDSCEFADKELMAARIAAGGAGAGIAAGASVAFMAPTAAMWIATTFGTASTGAAISTLSGAAATNAALAGPVGWSIAGATLLTSIIIFTSKKTKLNKQKNEEIETVKNNTEKVKEMDAQIAAILDETASIRDGLVKQTVECMKYFNADYSSFSSEDKKAVGALVNNTKALSAMFAKTVQ